MNYCTSRSPRWPAWLSSPSGKQETSFWRHCYWRALEGKRERGNGGREREGGKIVLTWQSRKILMQINTNVLGMNKSPWATYKSYQLCSSSFFYLAFPLLLLFFFSFYSFYVIRGCRSLVFPRIPVKILLASGRQKVSGVMKTVKQQVESFLLSLSGKCRPFGFVFLFSTPKISFHLGK